MSSFLQLCKALLVVTAALSLASCSVLEWFQGTSEPVQKVAQEPAKSSGWNFSQQWQLDDTIPPISGINDNTFTLSGQCSFSPELTRALKERNKGVLLPVLEVAEDFTVAPDLEISANLYKALNQNIRLSGPGDSLELYQTVVAAVEHSCPANLTRDIDSCQFKKWMSFAGLGGSESIYDEDRLNHWYKKHKSVDYLVMNSAGLYNSKAMLNTRYSKHSRVITEQSDKVKNKSVRPFVGNVRFDWVAVEKNLSAPFTSKGFCSVSWVELDDMRRMKGLGWQPTDRLVKVSQFLLPHSISFMQQAMSTLTSHR